MASTVAVCSRSAGLQALVGVHVGVVGAGLVVHRVLDELEAGNADGVEGEVIGAAGVAMVMVVTPRSLSGAIHWAKMGPTAAVVLRVDAADFAGAVVDVEVGVERLPLRLGVERAAARGA